MVAVVEGAAEFDGHGFRVGEEFADDVGLVEVVCVDEKKGAGYDTTVGGVSDGRLGIGLGEEGGG